MESFVKTSKDFALDMNQNIFFRDNLAHEYGKLSQLGNIIIVSGVRGTGKTSFVIGLLQILCPDTSSQVVSFSGDKDIMGQINNDIELIGYIKENTGNQYLLKYIVLDEICHITNRDKAVLKLGKLYPNCKIFLISSNNHELEKLNGNKIIVGEISFGESGMYGYEYKYEDYLMYGGMPELITLGSNKERSYYLSALRSNIMMNDIVKYNVDSVQNIGLLNQLASYFATNPGIKTTKNGVTDTFKKHWGLIVSPNTIQKYLNYLLDCGLINKVLRFDIPTGRVGTQREKYYFGNLGLAKVLSINTLSNRESAEILIYNHLRLLGDTVYFGVYNNNDMGFVVQDNDGYTSTYCIADEKNSVDILIKKMLSIKNNYPKTIIDITNTYQGGDVSGITIVSLKNFLLSNDF